MCSTAPRTRCELVPGGVLAAHRGRGPRDGEFAARAGRAQLGAGLEVEARAPDGLIEAFRVRGARGFALAVQWHPEWQVMTNPFSRALFAAFGEAAHERTRTRTTDS